MPPILLPAYFNAARWFCSSSHGRHTCFTETHFFLHRVALPSHPPGTRSHSDTQSLLQEICVLPFSTPISCRISIFRTSKSNFARRPGIVTISHFEANRTSFNIICFRSAHIIAPLFIGRPTSSLRSSSFRSSITFFPIMDPAAHISADSTNRQHENVCTLPARISEENISALPQKQRRPSTHLESGTQFPELQEALSTPRGALVVVEGLDRSGKSTQCEQLVDYLKSQGKRVQHIKFPDRSTATGRSLDAYLKNALELGDLAVHKIFFQNRLEKMEEMEAALLEGVNLIVDRYSYSGVAFSAAKGLDVKWCKKVETPLPAPDLVLYLTIPVEVAAQRGAYGAERYEKMEFQRKVGQQFAMLRDASWKDVDATEDMDSVQMKMRQLVDEVVGNCLGGVPPLERMWAMLEEDES